jgi:hypothetical protein
MIWLSPWFLGALSISAAVLFIGWLKSPKKRKPEPDVWLAGEYAGLYYNIINFAEELYQEK